MADFESFEGPYASWSIDKHKDALNEFLYEIGSTVLYGWAVAVMLSHHEALEQKYKDRIPSPYRLAASFVWGAVGNWIRKNFPSEYAEYIFELGDPEQGPMRNEVDKLKESPTWRELGRVLTVSFADKRCVPALQPADILAYETLRHAQLELGYAPPGRKLEMRYPLRRLLESGAPHDSALLTSDAMYSFAVGIVSPSDEVEELKRIIGSELRRQKAE